jgi:outer membrane lipoprotein-sorting protein
MKFLRTASTGRLLAMLAGVVIAIAGGTAIAVAATGSGPVPRAKPLAQALHGALAARPVDGISADIQFTNNLISSTNFAGGPRDPILQGATGRLWLSKDHGLRLELQSSNGDSQIVVNQRSFWVSDPSSQTVYEGTIPADAGRAPAKAKASGSGMPTVAQIQTELNHLLGRMNVAGAGTSNPTDIAGQPAYSVTVSPKHDGGLLGSAQIAWDAVTGTPLNLAIYARGNSTPVLQIKATNISFGPVAPSTFALAPPAGYKVVKVSAPASHRTGPAGAIRKARQATHSRVTGVAAVARAVPFRLAAPARLVGLPRQDTTLLDWGGHPAALVTYGQNLGGVAIIEQKADPASSQAGSGSGSAGGLSLPSVSINGATGTELSTALGTVLRYTSGGVAYTVLGSVQPFVAEQAAKALTP